MLRVSDLLLKGAMQTGEREKRRLSNARKNYIRTHLDWVGRPAEAGAEHSAGGARQDHHQSHQPLRRRSTEDLRSVKEIPGASQRP